MPKRKAMKGRGFWDTFKNIAGGINDVLKKTKIISTVGSLIPNGGVQAGAKIAGQLGYGRPGLAYSAGLKGAGRRGKRNVAKF